MTECASFRAGDRIGRWTVIRESTSIRIQHNDTEKKTYRVRCACGVEDVRDGKRLASNLRLGVGGCPSKACQNRYATK